MLQGLTPLRRLDLGHNDISPIGAVVIAESIAESEHLEFVAMDGNPIGRTGARAFFRTTQRQARTHVLSQKLRQTVMTSRPKSLRVHYHRLIRPNEEEWTSNPKRENKVKKQQPTFQSPTFDGFEHDTDAAATLRRFIATSMGKLASAVGPEELEIGDLLSDQPGVVAVSFRACNLMASVAGRPDFDPLDPVGTYKFDLGDAYDRCLTTSMLRTAGEQFEEGFRINRIQFSHRGSSLATSLHLTIHRPSNQPYIVPKAYFSTTAHGDPLEDGVRIRTAPVREDSNEWLIPHAGILTFSIVLVSKTMKPTSLLNPARLHPQVRRIASRRRSALTDSLSKDKPPWREIGNSSLWAIIRTIQVCPSDQQAKLVEAALADMPLSVDDVSVPPCAAMRCV